jgi:putative transposase
VLRVVTDESTRGALASALDEICGKGARRMLAAPLEAEAEAYIAELVGETDELGHSLATRNGQARARTITTGSGPIRIEAPRVNDRWFDPNTGEKQRFRSSIVPLWARRFPQGGRGAGVGVSARPVDGRLRAGTHRVLRVGRGCRRRSSPG